MGWTPDQTMADRSAAVSQEAMHRLSDCSICHR